MSFGHICGLEYQIKIKTGVTSALVMPTIFQHCYSGTKEDNSLLSMIFQTACSLSLTLA